jgi:predicted Zn finger-like uncharacterized protein
MIVTCPGCSSKYRVRNEAVPADGARMRCPKCETLFLAKPPAAGEAGARLHDDPSSMYQQINPHTTGPVRLPTPSPMSPGSMPAAPPAPAQQPPQPFVPAAPKTAGPVTALFGAVDPAALPPEAQRPPPPAPAPLAASGLALGGDGGRDEGRDGLKMRVQTSPTTSAPRTSEREAALPATLQAVVGSWIAVGAGGLLAVFGLVFFLWTTERANLDGALMPFFERTFGVEPPRSSLAAPNPSAEALRQAAGEASARGDFAAAITLWQRARARDPADARAAAAIAKLRAELGDLEGAS